VHPGRAPVGGQDRARAQHGRQRRQGRHGRRHLLAGDGRRAAGSARAVRRGTHQPARRAHRLRQRRRLVRHPHRDGKLANLEFYVDDTPSISILELRAKAAVSCATSPRGSSSSTTSSLCSRRAAAREPSDRDRRDLAWPEDSRQGAGRAGSRTLAALASGRAACRQAPTTVRPARIRR